MLAMEILHALILPIRYKIRKFSKKYPNNVPILHTSILLHVSSHQQKKKSMNVKRARPRGDPYTIK